MAGFRRTVTNQPTLDFITAIEGTVVVDLTPPGTIVGAGTGVVLLVGEFENGPLDAPTEILGDQDLLTRYGGLGFVTENHAHDGAVARKSGGDELWNGNGFIWLSRKRFRTGLILCRVDNSAGSVAFSRLACLTGGDGPFSVANSDTITFQRDGTTNVVATFTGSKATIVGQSGTFTGLNGLTLELKIDQDATRVVTFQTADNTLSLVIDRINNTLAQTVAFDTGGELDVRSIIEGASARVEVVGGTAVTTLGHVLTPTQQVSTATVNSQTDGTYTLRITKDVNGVSTNFDATHSSSSETTTALRDSLLTELGNLGLTDISFASGGGDTIVATGDGNVVFSFTVEAEPTPSDVTIAATTPPRITVDTGLGNVGNLANFSVDEAVTVITALTGITAERDADGFLRVCNSGTPASGTLQATTGNALTPLGFNAATIANAGSAEDVTIPAGTRIRDTTTQDVWVTMEDIDTGTGGGAFTAKVRPFEDTDSAVPSAIGAVTEILDALPDGFSCTNAAAITRLSASQLDARYQQALDATIDAQGVAAKANIVASARTSSAIMAALRKNARDATAEGHAARKAVTRPPLGTSVATQITSTGVGVGTERLDRYVYCGVGFKTLIPEIQEIGAVVGGTGFTDDGIINVGSDSFYCSVRSILAPEENAGQDLTSTDVQALNVVALEDTFDPVEGGTKLGITEYKTFLANGIVAPRFDRQSGFVFQSDVTTVDPAINVAQVDANRRYFADFIIDSLHDIGNKHSKKIVRLSQERAVTADLRSFFKGLRAEDQPETSRIQDWSVRDVSSEAQRGLGVRVFDVKVKMLFTDKFIVFQTTVGPTVTVDQVV